MVRRKNKKGSSKKNSFSEREPFSDTTANWQIPPVGERLVDHAYNTNRRPSLQENLDGKWLLKKASSLVDIDSSGQGIFRPRSNSDSSLVSPTKLASTVGFPNRRSLSRGIVALLQQGMTSMEYDVRRPNYNQTYGKSISLTVNYVALDSIPEYVHRYEIEFFPEKVPRSIKRKVMELVIEKYPEVFTGENGQRIRPAYDAKGLFFTIRKLIFPDSKFIARIHLARDIGGPPREFVLTFRYGLKINVRELTLKLFRDVHETGLTARHILDVILRHQPSLDYIPIGLNYFTKPGRYDLGSGREAWYGFHHNVVPCHGKFGMVVDVASTAFFKEQSVVDFTATLLKRDKEDLKRKKGWITEDERKLLNSELIGLKVKTHHGRTPRLFRVYCVGRATPSFTHFDCRATGNRISVKDFFSKKYNIELEYPDLPVLHLGKGDRTAFIPMELCKLVKGQRVLKKLTEQQATTMIRMMASMAPDRRKEVDVAIKDVDVPNNPVAKEFNVSAFKNDQLMKAEGVILEPPSIEYNDARLANGTPVIVTPNKGTWEMYDKQFKEARLIDEWGVLNLAPREIDEPKVREVIYGLIGQGSSVGLDFNEEYAYYQSYGNQTKESIDRALEYLKREKPKMIFLFVVLDGKQTTYSHLKSAGDKYFGFVSQCIRWKSIKKGVNNQVLTNLCMKINHKLGGVNCVISNISKENLKILDAPIIVMGATLSHPHHPEPRRPSVASLVGSMDASPAQFSSCSTVQSRIHQHIVDLSEMVKSILLDFYQRNAKLKPHRIIFYRDAIRDSMFLTIAQREINAIRRACLALEGDEGYRPGITFIILQRRHNTRLFCSDPADASGRSGNVPAGTCLDNTITHPHRFDFYLASHYGIQGTSRPTYYRVMWDDNNLSAEEIQSLTYMMCYCYARCTRSVTVPAPTYYAHLAAVRTRHHLTDGDIGVHYDEEGLPLDEADIKKAMEVITIHKDNRTRMFFT
ncbi:protein argonaute-2-like [Lepeophtheirus salmonis]|uniref:protein argonaute-2-like n=1 Tax=Lepeophtheirus salmonis TaxID=72036 RepID=UPI001AEB610C|nr:protein argonaute-2-like [Lepeophtheirus salmonis]